MDALRAMQAGLFGVSVVALVTFGCLISSGHAEEPGTRALGAVVLGMAAVQIIVNWVDQGNRRTG